MIEETHACHCGNMIHFKNYTACSFIIWIPRLNSVGLSQSNKIKYHELCEKCCWKVEISIKLNML